MATKTKKTTKHSASLAKTNRRSLKTKTTAKKSQKTQITQKVTASIGWRILWILICTVVSSCLLIAIDDAIFGVSDRVLAEFTDSGVVLLNSGVEITGAVAWEEIVAQQLAQDIFIPIAWGTLFTIVEAYILYKARLVNRSATSAILIAALWLLPIALAVIRIVSCYAFTFSTAS